jgi:hypothetical protein
MFKEKGESAIPPRAKAPWFPCAGFYEHYKWDIEGEYWDWRDNHNRNNPLCIP